VADTRARLGTQGDHRKAKEQLVADEVIEHDDLTIERDRIGVRDGQFELLGMWGAVRGRLDGESRDLVLNRDACRFKTPRTRHHQLGSKDAAYNHVAPAPREPHVEIAVAIGRADVRPLQCAAQPSRSDREAKLLARDVEIVRQNGVLVMGHRSARFFQPRQAARRYALLRAPQGPLATSEKWEAGF
jgi:hypothetical protein